MILSYTLNSRTADNKRIFGNVIFDCKAKISPQGDLNFSILSFNIYCHGVAICGCGNTADTMRFPPGPTGSDTIVTGLGLWSMGEWNNGGCGIWFENADRTRYEEPDISFGKLEQYRHLGPRIVLCADMVTQGPFQPVENVWLTWDPQLYLHDGHTLAPPEGVTIKS